MVIPMMTRDQKTILVRNNAIGWRVLSPNPDKNSRDLGTKQQLRPPRDSPRSRHVCIASSPSGRRTSSCLPFFFSLSLSPALSRHCVSKLRRRHRHHITPPPAPLSESPSSASKCDPTHFGTRRVL
ncbi:hypothetical protein NL676_029705 [Syzygium grande]|nr:hypothetical protein NL676_029705 [Syzygium grande]